MTPALGRRPGIDGLRALAVTSVVAYHLRPYLLPAGYVGVDVFLVVSGFLITRLLLDEQARSGKIDIRAFWARRVRRLVPAALSTIAAVMVWVAVTESVDRFARLRGDVVASIGYMANWWFAM